MTEPHTAASPPTEEGAPTSELYDASYYASHCGESYERSEPWLSFFGAVAENIVKAIAPSTVLDAGCAMGFLVEALRDRGVDAYGLDLSEYAIRAAREDVRPFLRVGSVLDPLPQRYDLITCIEVLEHLEPAAAEAAVRNFAEHTDDVLFASTPVDYREETHINVHPPEDWAALFARYDFFRDVDHDAAYLTPWATRFRRRRDPLERIVMGYERRLWHLRHENTERHQVVIAQMNRINELLGTVEKLTGASDDQRERIACLERDIEARAADFQGDLEDAHGRLAVVSEQAQSMRVHAQNLTGRLTAIEGSRTFRIAHRASRAAHRVAPPGTARDLSLRRLYAGAALLVREGPRGVREAALQRRGHVVTPPSPSSGGDDEAAYREWLRDHEPGLDDLLAKRAASLCWAERPVVSIVMPVYNPEASWLEAAISSVLAQVYGAWELCIADDHSPSPHVREVLDRFAAADSRILVTFREHNGGIAEASNTALSLARGEWVAFLDHDDVLRPHALHESMAALRENPGWDMVFSDEDKVMTTGLPGHAAFKPAYSRDLLLGSNYLCHFTIIRRRIVEGIGGFRLGYDGSQDHDLFLRASERAREVGHLPQILYGWRQVPGSAALSNDSKPAAWENGRRAVADALERSGERAVVELGERPGHYVVRRPLIGTPQVRIVIPQLHGSVEVLERCLLALERVTTWPHRSVVVVESRSRSGAARANRGDVSHSVQRVEGPRRWTRLVNAGAHGAWQHLVVLDPAAEVLTPGWLEMLMEQSQRSGVGVVGTRLFNNDGSLHQVGGRVGGDNPVAPIDTRWPVVHPVSAVGGACMMTSRDAWDRLGGFDERYRVSLGEVDYCLRAQSEGFGVVYSPLVDVRYDAESNPSVSARADRQRFRERWGEWEKIVDPAVSPYVTRYFPLTFRAVGVVGGDLSRWSPTPREHD